MSNCIEKLTHNISYDCTTAHRAKGGLETKAVILNRTDLDLSSITFLFFGFLIAVIAGSSWALKQLQAEIDDPA